MSEVTNNELYEKLGYIAAKVESIETHIAKHVEDDKEVQDRVTALEADFNQRQGKSRLINAGWSFLGVVVGILVDWKFR